MKDTEHYITTMEIWLGGPDFSREVARSIVQEIIADTREDCALIAERWDSRGAAWRIRHPEYREEWDHNPT